MWLPILWLRMSSFCFFIFSFAASHSCLLHSPPYLRIQSILTDNRLYQIFAPFLTAPGYTARFPCSAILSLLWKKLVMIWEAQLKRCANKWCAATMMGAVNTDSCGLLSPVRKNIPHKHRHNRCFVAANKADDKVDAGNWASAKGLTLTNHCYYDKLLQPE